MAKRTKVLSGESARKYFRSLFAADPDQTPAAAERLTETCVREISELRVRVPLVSRRLAGQGAIDPASPLSPSDGELADGNEPPEVMSGPDEAPLKGEREPVAKAPVEPSVDAKAEERAADSPPASPVAGAPFDPFAFSLIVVLRREGREGLLSRLKSVGDAARLRQIAKAQHVSVRLADDVDADEIDALCLEIIAGTERRVAHREAAAS